MQINRSTPALPASAMKSYELRSPLATHWRDATCAEVDCPNRQRGWRTVLDVTDPKRAEAATWIRMHSGRHYTVEEAGDLVTFTFGPGQNCFEQHRLPLDRPEFYVVRGGDWRGNPRGEVRQHTSAASWQEDFAEHQDRLKTAYERG